MLNTDQTACFGCQSGLANVLFRVEPPRPGPALAYDRPIRRGHAVTLRSEGEEIAGKLFLPTEEAPAPALIVCHGAGDWKENYFELCEYLAERGIATFAIDLHGHGQSGGDRFFINIKHWVSDIRAAVEYLSAHPRIHRDRIAAFGLSSGGTAILEAALEEPRLRALVALDATVRNSLPTPLSLFMKSLLLLGKIKKKLTNKPMRLPLGKLSVPQVASDPEINRRITTYPPSLEAFMNFPLPGAEQSFFVDTIERVQQLRVPTLVLWGGDDKVDPPETGRMLFEKLTCRKRLEIIPGNGHVGHLDRNRDQVFHLTADWILESLTGESVATPFVKSQKSDVRIIEGEAAKALSPAEKWELLSPFLKEHGSEALAYATLQHGMEYFLDETGYIAYTTVSHPVFARRPKRIVLSDPVCAPERLEQLVRRFLERDRRGVFGVISERCAEVLRPMGFKINCLGYEPSLPIQTYNTQGNWKELDLVKRARNEAKREGIVIREEKGEALNRAELSAVSAKWISAKKINDREIWIYARRPVFGPEEDVRKFVAYDRDGHVAGFVFYDPMYRHGEVFGYSANIVRCDEQRFGRLATAVHMTAIEQFRAEGKEVLNLLMAPFVELEMGKYNDDWMTKLFCQFSARFGNDIYNFKGLSFHKSKYRGKKTPVYYASNSFFPSNDIYLAFVSADVSHSYFQTLGQLLRGMFSAGHHGKSD